jgi:propanediol dehydratase small subunit
MKRAVRLGVLWGFLTSVLGASVEAQDLPARVKLAQDLARAHAASAPGKQWLALNHGRAAQLMVPVLQKCVDEVQDGEIMSFSTYLRLSQKGKVLEIVTELDDELGRCMTKEARDVQLPAAPREDFWIQVNLAAML